MAINKWYSQPGLLPVPGYFPAIDCFLHSPTFVASFVLSTVWSYIFADNLFSVLLWRKLHSSGDAGRKEIILVLDLPVN